MPSTVRRSRPLRAGTALLLALTVASTGAVTLAAPASAAPPPAPTLTSTPAPPTDNDPTPSWAWTPVNGTTYECAFALASVTSPAFAACTTPFTAPALSAGGGADGDYRFAVRETGAAATATDLYTFDSVGSVTVLAPPSPGRDVRPTWTLQPEAGGSTTCTLDGGSASACAASYTPAADLPEGSHTLAVVVTDGLGNTGTATSTITVDLTAPAAPTVTGSNGLHNTAAVTWTWSTAAGDTSSCVLTGPAGVGAPAPCNTGTFTQNVATDGDYSVAVTLTDAAGNVGVVGTSPTYTFDGTAPAASAFLSGPAATDTDTTPTWTFSTPAASTTCQLSGPAPVPAGGACAGGTYTPGVALGDGSWSLTVTTQDPAGNTSATTSGAYLLDTTGPAAPVVSLPGGPRNNGAPRFTWTGEMPTVGWCRLVRIDADPMVGTTYGPWEDCTPAFYDPVLSGDAGYRVQAYLVDPLGNVGATGVSAVYQYDGTPPATPVLVGAPLQGHDTTPTFTFTPEVGGNASCWYVLGGTDSTHVACQGGSYSPVLATDGSYTIRAQLTDPAGNVSAIGSRGYDLDSSLPGAPTITAPASPGKGPTVTWTLTGDGSALTCRMLRGATVLAGPVGCPTQYTADLNGQPDATYTLEVTATNAYGSITVTTSAFVLDTTSPAPATITGPVSPGNAVNPSWTFPVQSQTTATCRLNQGTWTDCSLGQYAASSLPDGDYTLEAVVTDLAGNTSTVATSTVYTSDRTVPAAPAVTSPVSPGNNPAPTWTWTGEAGARATCRLDRAGVIGSAGACNSGTFTPTLTGDADYVVVVQLTDAAGNVSPATSTPSYLLDTAAPATPQVTGPAGIGKVGTPVWTFTQEAGSVATCRLLKGGVAVTAFLSCVSGGTVTLPGDGDYVFQVQVADAAGNVSSLGVGAVYSFDGTAPAAPVVTAPLSPSKGTKPAFSFTAEANSTTECRVLRSGALVQDWAACTSPLTVDLTGAPDGTYVLEGRATDGAGNLGASGAALGYVLDTTPPDPPTVSTPAGPSTNAGPVFTWTTTESGLTATCRLVHDGVSAPTTFACTSPYTASLPSDGTWSLRVRVLDAAGNVSQVAISGGYVFDTTAPIAPVVNAPPSPGRNDKPSWAVTAESGTTSECTVSSSGGALVSGWTSCALPVTTDLSARPDGSYVLSVRSTDAVGLTGPVGSASYLLDRAAPAAPVFTAQTASPGNTRTLSFSFTAEAGTTVVCRLSSGATVLSTDPTCTSPEGVSLTGLGDGPYTLSAQATDKAGNTGAAQTATYVLDTVAPAAPVLVTGPAATAPDRTPTWVFTTESRATVVCRVTSVSGGIVVPDTACAGSFTADLSTRPDDLYTFTALATDEAGNPGTSALSRTYQLDATAPATAQVTAPSSPGRDSTPTWQVSAVEGQVQCRVLKGAAVVRDWTSCGPTFSLNLTGDGTYTFGARVVDTAGNLSAEVTSRYVLDTTPPAAAALTTPVSPSTDRSPVWTIASPETSPSATCEVLGPLGSVVKPFAPCAVSVAGSPYSLDLTNLATSSDGPWTLVVRLTDRAGNAAPDATGTYRLDTTAPNRVLVVAPASPSATTTPVWQLTGDADATLECRFTAGGTGGLFAPCLATPGVPGSGSFTADLTSKADGTYTLAVRSRDAAGNVGPETTSGYTLDTIAPVTPQPPVAPPSPSQQRTIGWTFTVEAGATGYCTLSSATTVVAPEQACTSPWSTSLAADGDYVLALRAVDAAGNASGSASEHYVLDTTAPADPAITNAPGSPSPDLTPTWTLQPSDAKDVLECQLLGAAVPVWAACTSPVSFDLAPAVSGTYQLLVRETDDAGNVSATVTSAPYVLDLTAPPPPDVFAPQVQRSNSTSPVFDVQRQAGDVDTVSLRCAVTRFDGGLSTAAPCDFGSNTVDLTGLLGDEGPVVLSVAGLDALGNVSSAATATYFFDAHPPITPTLLAPDPTAAFAATVVFTFGNVPDAAGFLCELRSVNQVGPVQVTSCSSPDTLVLPAFGTYVFSVWAVDQAGNQSAVPQTATYTYLPAVPTLPAAKGPTGGTDETPTWTLGSPVGYTVECLLGLPDGQALSYPCTTPFTAPRAAATSSRTASVVRTSTFTANLTGRTAGTYSLSMRLTDAYGHLGAVSPKALYKYAPALAPNHLGGVPGGSSPPPAGGRGPSGNPGPGPGPGNGPGTQPVPPGTAPQVTGDQPVHRPDTTVNPSVKTPVRSQAGPASLFPTILPKLRDLPEALGKGLAASLKKPTIPLLLVVVVVGFLLLQNRIDRRDPKLAAAPVGAEPELEFGGPVVRRPPVVRPPYGGGVPT